MTSGWLPTYGWIQEVLQFINTQIHTVLVHVHLFQNLIFFLSHIYIYIYIFDLIHCLQWNDLDPHKCRYTVLVQSIFFFKTVIFGFYAFIEPVTGPRLKKGEEGDQIYIYIYIYGIKKKLGNSDITTLFITYFI
jgi:hypothetical protein